MSAPAVLASVTIGALLIGDKLEHFGLINQSLTLAPRALQASSYLRALCVACAWATVVALLVSRAC